MVQIVYSKEKGLKQQSGEASFVIPEDVVLTHPLSQTVSGNTIATLDFGQLVHAAAPAQANQVNLNSKYFRVKSANSKEFYVWFNVAAAGVDPQLEDLTGVQVDVANADDIDAAGDIATQLVAKLNNNGDFSEEFFATKTDNTVEICALRMGDSGRIISDISLLTGLSDGADNVVSVDVSYVEGVGSYIVSSVGLSLVKDASAKANGNSFVVVDNLTQESHFGVRKIILSGHPNDVEIKNLSEQGASLGTFDAEGDTLHLVWNGSEWRQLHN